MNVNGKKRREVASHLAKTARNVLGTAWYHEESATLLESWKKDSRAYCRSIDLNELESMKVICDAVLVIAGLDPIWETLAA